MCSRRAGAITTCFSEGAIVSSFWNTAAGAFAAGGLLIGSSASATTVLYDNGSVSGTTYAWSISGGLAIADSFTLSGPTTIGGVDFGAWTDPATTVSTVQWAIATTSSDFTGPYLDSGTALVGSHFVTLDTSNGYDVSVDSFTTGPISLGAGTYYLILQNAVTYNGTSAYWVESDGPSSAFQNWLGNLADYRPGTASESFQLFGTNQAGTPEPAVWIMMLVGFAGLGARLRACKARPTRTPQPPSAILSR